MKQSEFIRGRIAGCSRVEQYSKKNGQTGVKCIVQIDGNDGTQRAISLSGDLTNWAGQIDRSVEIEYVCRVFSFKKNGKDWYGNDLYAINIKLI